MLKRTIEYWESNAAKYERDRFGNSFGRFLRQLEIETFLSLVSPSQKAILDVGAGTGKLCIALSSQYREVIALDLCKEMVKIARENADNEGVKIMAVVCDAQQLCFKDETFDCVVSSRLLMHLNDRNKVISEICRVSRNEVVLDFPSVLSFGALHSLFEKCKKVFRPGSQAYATSLSRKVVYEFLSHDFETVLTTKRFFMPFAFHRWLDNASLSLRIEKVFRLIGLTELGGAPVTLKAKRISNQRRGNRTNPSNHNMNFTE